MRFCCVGAGLHLEMMAERFINKALHTPTHKIKHAAGTERERRLIETIRHLFGIGDERRQKARGMQTLPGRKLLTV